LLFAMLAANVDPTALDRCTRIADDPQRLACYDALLRPAGRTAAAPVAAPVATPDAAPVVAPVASAAPAAAPAAPVGTSVATAPAVAAATASAAAAALPAPVADPAPASPAEEFGLSAEQRLAKKTEQEPQEMDSITARVAVVRQLRNDRFALILENDQIWTQVEPTPRQRFYVGDEIRIRRASLGSFLATGPNTGGAIRVRRVE
jgi:hypothetical protein